MPRRRATPAAPPELADSQLPGLDDLDHDPQPVAARRPSSRSAVGRAKSAPRSSTTGRMVSKTAQVNQVRAEVQTYLTLANAAFMIRDPSCASVVQVQIPEIADATAALIGRNEAMLAVMTKSGILTDVIRLLGAALPIVRVIWSAHGPGGSGHELEERDDADRYPARTH